MKSAKSLLRLVGVCLLIITTFSPAGGETRWWNPRRGYIPFSDRDTVPLVLDNSSGTILRVSASLSHPGDEFTLSLRAANRHSHPRKRYSHTTSAGKKRSVSSPGWSIYAAGAGGDTLRIGFRSMESHEAGDGISSVRAVEITAERCGSSIDGAPCPPYTILTTDLNPDTGWNSLRLIRKGNSIRLYGGTRRNKPLLELTAPLSTTSEIGFEAEPAARLDLDFISLETPDSEPDNTVGTYGLSTDSLLEKANSSKDEMEGEWVVFDRSLDESALRMGGDYRLLIVGGEKGYDILYLSGARTCRDEWKEGRLKARLKSTAIRNVWDVEWHDAEGKILTRDIRAQYDDPGGLLTITFPYSSSSLRLIPVR